TLARRAAYLAPEQVRGEAVNPATDVYALGVLLFEMVVGRPPFIGDSPMATAERRVREHAHPAGMFEPTIPPALEGVISRALERSPDKRWPSMWQLDSTLADLTPAQLKPLDANSLPQIVTLPGRSRPRRGIWAAFGLSVPALAAVVACVLVISFLVPFLKGVPVLAGGSRKVDVPELIGIPISDARALALSRGLELTVVSDRPTDRVPKGQIVQQAPVAGWRADDRQPIRVTLSAGVTVPDVRGKSLENAQAQLAELGWRVAKVERGSYPGYPAGTIVLQFPQPGEVAYEPGELALA